MQTNQNKLKLKIEELLGEKITQFVLQGKGACNNAYSVETNQGGQYIVKQARDDKELHEQNNLIVEAKVAQTLFGLNLAAPTPRVVFVSENPEMYGYEYLPGNLMIEEWASLSEDERICICTALGYFHAEIGQKFTEEMAQACGVQINASRDIHPESIAEYERLIVREDVPEQYKTLAKEARAMLDTTMERVVFQFVHNDSHHENIIIKDKMISGIIDFGDAEYGEIAKEFSRYIRDYPDYFPYIVSAYEKKSGNKLCYKRLVSNALLSGFVDIVENYEKGGENRVKAEKAITTYRRLMDEAAIRVF